MRPAEVVSVARMTCHSTFKKLARLMFQAHFFKFRAASNGSIKFIPKSSIFGGFQLLGTPTAAFQHQSAPFPLFQLKYCHQMRFLSLKYTKLHLRRDLDPNAGAYSTHTDA